MNLRPIYFLISMTLCVTVELNAQNDLQAELLSTWKKHSEMNILLIKGIKPDYLTDKSTSGGRTVGEMFAHMHEVRMMWVEEMLKKVDTKDLDTEIDTKESSMHDYLTKQLELSNQVMTRIHEKALNDGTRFGEMSAVRLIGYLIAHEAHHRGQIMLALKQSGHELPPQVSYGIWQW